MPRGAHRKGRSDVPTGRRIGFRDQPAQLQQNGFMTIAPAPPIEQRLLGMAAAIRRLIPDPVVRLYSCGEAFGYGSRARGEAGPDSDVDLLITAPDAWLASRDRFALLADLWGAVAQPDLSGRSGAPLQQRGGPSGAAARIPRSGGHPRGGGA